MTQDLNVKVTLFSLCTTNNAVQINVSHFYFIPKKLF